MCIDKTVYVGTIKERSRRLPVFCRIQYDGARLSITGVIAPRNNGDADSCGQVVDSLSAVDPADNWDRRMIDTLAGIWRDYHLNDMHAGSPVQTAYLKEHAKERGTVDRYQWACDTLAAAGLNPDPDCIHNGAPYKYGTAWLSIDVPGEVIEWLESVPDPLRAPAWV